LDKVAVLDASAFMAMIQQEEGAEKVAGCLPWAIISAVNQCEALTKLILTGMEEERAWWHIGEINCECVPFDEEQAKIAGGLVRITRPFGLSLGDRACLALGIQRKATVYTTDRVWKQLDLGIEIEVIR
jgi:PIN domain nuclease of toxin-antitoxin system